MEEEAKDKEQDVAAVFVPGVEEHVSLAAPTKVEVLKCNPPCGVRRMKSPHGGREFLLTAEVPRQMEAMTSGDATVVNPVWPVEAEEWKALRGKRRGVEAYTATAAPQL